VLNEALSEIDPVDPMAPTAITSLGRARLFLKRIYKLAIQAAHLQ